MGPELVVVARDGAEMARRRLEETAYDDGPRLGSELLLVRREPQSLFVARYDSSLELVNEQQRRTLPTARTPPIKMAILR